MAKYKKIWTKLWVCSILSNPNTQAKFEVKNVYLFNGYGYDENNILHQPTRKWVENEIRKANGLSRDWVIENLRIYDLGIERDVVSVNE